MNVDPTWPASITRGTAASAAELGDQAHGFRLLNALLGQDDVYQVNVYRQLQHYTATITFKQHHDVPTRHEEGLAAIGIGNRGTQQHIARDRTMSSHADTLYKAVRGLVASYDQFHRNPAG
jgi:hypothetical protein